MKYIAVILMILAMAVSCQAAPSPSPATVNTPAATPTIDPNAPKYKNMKCSYTGVGDKQKWKCDYTDVCNSGYKFVPRAKGSPDIGTCVSE